MARKKNYYAVAVGRNPGIYTAWYGNKGAEAQVKGCTGAVFKGFVTKQEAEAFMNEYSAQGPLAHQGRIAIYTDGGAINNPGPGGYGVVTLKGNQRTELSRGYRLTTNNRMELIACIAGLKAVKKPSSIVVHSDSKYVVDGVAKGWAKRWQRNGWMRTKTDRALNPDLWEQLLELCNFHQVRFKWIKGHAGHPENEKCDRLAASAAKGKELLVDKAYEEKLSSHSKIFRS